MSYGAGGAAAAAQARAIAQAIKASGAIVQVKPEEFLKLLNRTEKPLVINAPGGLFRKHYEYISSYKGLVFFTQSPTPLMLPGSVEIVAAGKIWIPG